MNRCPGGASARRYACLAEDPVTEGPFALTTVQDAHIEPIRLWRNAQIDVLRQPAPIAPEEQVRYYERAIWPTLADPQPANLLLSFLEGGAPIGYGGLVHLAWEHRRAEVSFLVDPVRAADPESYERDFTVFLRLLKRVAFEGLRLDRLCTEVYDIRPAHVRILEANGFVLEGRLRGHVRIGGRPVDSLIHGCLREPG